MLLTQIRPTSSVGRGSVHEAHQKHQNAAPEPASCGWPTGLPCTTTPWMGWGWGAPRAPMHKLLVLDRMPIAISLLNAFLWQFKTSKTTPKFNFIIPWKCIEFSPSISLLLNPVLLLANRDCIEALAAAFVRHKVGGLHLDIHSHQVDVHPLTSRTQRTSHSHHSRLGCLCTSGRQRDRSSSIRQVPKFPWGKAMATKTQGEECWCVACAWSSRKPFSQETPNTGHHDIAELPPPLLAFKADE